MRLGFVKLTLAARGESALLSERRLSVQVAPRKPSRICGFDFVSGRQPDQKFAAHDAKHFHRGLLALSLFAIAACASGRDIGVQRPTNPITWPPGGTAPRVELLYTYEGTDRQVSRTGMFSWLEGWVFGSDPLRFQSPYGLARTKQGLIAVADTAAGGVHFVDFDAAVHEFWAEADVPMVSPIGVAIGPKEHIFVTDSTTCRVYVLATDGRSLGSFGGPEQMGRPTGIAYDSTNDRLLITDTTGCRILSYSTTGEQLEIFGERGVDLTQFNYPTNLAVGTDGSIVIVDTMNFRIQVLSPEFELVSSFGLGGDGPGAFARPKGVAVDSDGNIYVVDAMFDNVQVFNQQGELLLVFGVSGSNFGEMYLPAGIFIDEQDRIYIADSGNSRIQVFRYHSGN